MPRPLDVDINDTRRQQHELIFKYISIKVIDEAIKPINRILARNDSCFARNFSFQPSGMNCNVSLATDEDDEEAMVHNYLPPNDGLESTVGKENEPITESLTLMKELLSQEEPHIRSSLPIFRGGFLPFPPSLLESMSRESTNIPTMSEPYEESGNLKEVEQPTKETVMWEESGNLEEQPTMSEPFEESGDLKEVEQPTKETVMWEERGNLKVQPTMSKPYKESGNLKEVEQPTKETVMWEESGNLKEQPTMSKPYEESENLKEVEQPTKETVMCDISSSKPSKASVVLGLPLQLSGEVIAEITGGFARTLRYKKENLTTYYGFLPDHYSRVWVKKFKGDSNGILKAEKKAALSIIHKNILKLIGYHNSENTTFLVFPNAKNRRLDNYLCGSGGKLVELKFQDKMKIAIETAQGVRYMHEECPQGPIVHGELLPCNIFLKDDFQPLISGFGQAKWLQVEHASPISNNRFWPNDPSNAKSMDLIKSDIFSFGVMLLRLFCRRSVPQDDKILIEWARPLLLQRAFHELLDEDTEVEDMHGIYRVMSAATQCTRTKPISRPCMSEVITILKGENFCAMQSSPSDNNIEKAEILNGLGSLHSSDDIHAVKP